VANGSRAAHSKKGQGARPGLDLVSLHQLALKYGNDDLHARQFAVDIESANVAMSHRRPEWALGAEPTVAKMFPNEIHGIRKLERARDGVIMLLNLLDTLPQERRREIEQSAFRAAGKAFDEKGDGAAITALFTDVLDGLRTTLALYSDSIPKSDRDMRKQVKLAALLEVFRRYGLPVASGEGSPFVAVCVAAGIGRRYVRKHLPAMPDPAHPKGPPTPARKGPHS